VADGFLAGSPDGRRRRAALRDAVAGSALRLLGPSSLGVANLPRALALTGNAAFAEDVLPVGDVFVASQSGSALGALLSRGAEMGVGFAGMVSTGNEFDLTLGEICAAAVDDPAVASFALFLENLGGADALASFARAAHDRGKPVVAYKLGRSDAGARLSESHTGALAGDDAVADAFFRAHGFVRVATFETLLEAQSLARRVQTGGARRQVAVVSTTGGGGAMAVDCLGAAGLDVIPPGEATRARLAELGIATGSGALVDLTLAGTTYDTIRVALDVLVAAPEFDAVLAVPGSSARFTPEVSVAPIIDCAATSDIPVLAFVVPAAPDALRLLRSRGVPAFRTAESCADALAATLGRAAPGSGAAVTQARVGAAVGLDEDAAYRLFDRVGLASPQRAVVAMNDLPDALPVPPPAAVKLLHTDVAHKSDVGGVVLGVRDVAALHAAALDIRAAVVAARPDLTVERLLVQHQVRGVAEVLIGLRRDPDAGAVVLLAAGGLLAEIYRDRSVRLAPVTVTEAHEMIAEVRGLRLAAGLRGAPRGDLDALARAVSALSQLALDPDVIEAEANPVLVLPEGQGIVAVDAVATVVATP
jgi:acyl-CoA synthetase (NDP forming)